MRNTIKDYWHQLAQMAEMMPTGLITRAGGLLLECHRRGGTVFILGNGGSAATASHFACDLAKGTLTDGLPAFRVVPLTDNVPLLTAWANDTSYERVFAEQLAALIRPADVVILISASGNSPNVLVAVDVAREAGATTIALTGQNGGRLGWIADLTIRVPAPSIELAEDAHLAIAHSLCVAIRTQLQTEIELRADTPPVLEAVIQRAV